LGSIKKIHVNQHNIKQNIKGANLPVVTVKSKYGNEYGHEVEILGRDGEVAARVIYPGKALECGARVWIETEGDVRIIDHTEETTLKISG